MNQHTQSGFPATFLIHQIEDDVQRMGSKQATAKHYGISPQYLGDVLLGRRDISDRFARILGFERVVVFTPLSNEPGAAADGREHTS